MLLAVVALALVGVASSCSDDGSSPTSTVAPAAPPRIDLIEAAVAAVEAKLGGPQRYFEINATRDLVNVIVSLNGGRLAQFWLYDGSLSSREPQPAQGFTFDALDALAFDPDLVLGKVQSDLPGSQIDLFTIEGGDGRAVRYSLLITSAQGGRLEAVVAGDGTVVSVDPVNG